MLSSFLISKTKNAKKEGGLDKDLDDIFNSSAKPSEKEQTTVIIPGNLSKRKRPEEDNTSPKKRKIDVPAQKTTATTPEKPSKLAKQTIKAADPHLDEEDTDEAEVLETEYLKQTESQRAKENDSGSGESSEEDDESPLVHESLTGVRTPKKKVIFTPEDESNDKRLERTIFIGNLSPEVLGSKSLQKSLKAHLLSYTPPDTIVKVESMRFRSVAFKAPTAPLPSDKPDVPESRDAKQKNRAASWKESSETQEKSTKQHLAPGEKRRIAFIKKEFHESATSVNAYIVLAHLDPKKFEKTTDPYAAASAIALKADGSQFLNRTLRIDIAVPTSKDSGSWEPKKTIFVGNLDYSTKEEDIRTLFDSLMIQERGPMGIQLENTNTDGSKNGWVHTVRVIRDPNTQLGKGFAYVRFWDENCVDEMLALDVARVKLNKRKLRVQRCKGSQITSLNEPRARKPQAQMASSQGKKPTVARGDPLLGEKLRGMSKEERKEIKKKDASRIARRMDKKKARDGIHVNAKAKERVRARKVKSTKSLKKV